MALFEKSLVKVTDVELADPKDALSMSIMHKSLNSATKTSVPRPTDFGISGERGFMSPDIIPGSLSDTCYDPWERIATSLPTLLTEDFRRTIRALPFLATDKLVSEAEWRRAYTILAFMCHGYVWCEKPPAERVPPNLSIPFLSTCNHLGLPPVLTYAGLCLYNFATYLTGHKALHEIRCQLSFTGTEDESWFYLISAIIEADGGRLIPLLSDALTAAQEGDVAVVTEKLQSSAPLIKDLKILLERVNERCDPSIFYNQIRPFLAGGKGAADAGLPRGILFEDRSGTEQFHQLGGGSASMSSLFQFLDLALGIKHLPTKSDENHQSDDKSNPQRSSTLFEEMRAYMPQAHRIYLQQLSKVPDLHAFVMAHQSDQTLLSAYYDCVDQLRAFRDAHIPIVTRYILLPSLQARRATAGDAMMNGNADVVTETTEKGVKGTAGSDIVVFLKQSRHETANVLTDKIFQDARHKDS